MKKFWRKLVSVMLTFTMVVLCLPEYVSPVKTANADPGDPSVQYVDENKETQTLSGNDYVLIQTTGNFWSGVDHRPPTWGESGTTTYYVVGVNERNVGDYTNQVVNYNNNSRVTVQGNVVLILPDFSDAYTHGLNIPAGIYVPEGASLTIYGGPNGGCSLTAGASNDYNAAIGGGYNNVDGTTSDCGTISIYGGTVTATGYRRGAGIGGGDEGNGGTITIGGGTVTATGGGYSRNGYIYGGAGIGGGDEGNGGTIVISGGKVNASGKNGSAGIGGGLNAYGGSITISDGEVTATGSGYNSGGTTLAGAGIGGGSNPQGTYTSTSQTILISGGTVTATGAAQRQAAAIGGGRDQSNCGTISITGGTVTATGANSRNTIGIGSYSGGAEVSITGGKVVATSNNGNGYGIYAASIEIGITDAETSVTAKNYHITDNNNSYITFATSVKIEGTEEIIPSGNYGSNNFNHIAGKTFVKAKNTIKFVDYDGTELKTLTLDLGEMPEYGDEDPQRPDTDSTTYTFEKWSPDIVAVSGDATYTAMYKETPRKYRVTFYDENGTIDLYHDDVEYGTSPVYGGSSEPSKEESEGYTYTFIGWVAENGTEYAKNDTLPTVAGATFYKAKFQDVVRQYTVKFVDEDGQSVLKAEKAYDYGTPASEIDKPEDPFKDADADYVYTFAGWTPTVSAVTGNVVYTATYTSEPRPYIELQANVEWIDGDDQDGYRPDTVTVTLSANREDIESVTLTKDVNWKHTFRVPKNDEKGVGITYTVTATDVDKYTKTIEGFVLDSEEGYYIIYIHETESTDVSVKKVWDDADDQDGYRPDSVTVNLLANGEIIDTVTLSEENEWSYKWTQLDLKAAGQEIEYTVTEEDVDGYTADIEEVEDGVFEITNSHETEETEVSVKKVWDDADDQDGYRPDSVTVNLLANGALIDTVTLSEENEWSYKWTLDLKAEGQEIEYTVTEDDVDEYTADIEEVEDGVFEITNSHETEKTGVSVRKVWDDADDQDGYRPDSVTVNLLANGEIIDTVTLSEENEWSYKWTRLDLKAAGQEIEYTVTEEEVDEYTADIAEVEDGVFEITNSHETEETEVSVRKIWDDADDQDGYRPDSVTVNLLANGALIDTVTLSEENEWSYKWTQLDLKAEGQEIEYTVTEDDVDGYTANIEEESDGVFTITNSHETEETEVSVTKIWDDADDQDGYRPDSVTVNLLANGALIDTVTLSEENEWSYTWTQLDLKAAGQLIEYTVTEEDVDEYTADIEEVEDGVFEITNSHETEETEVSVRKVWDDANDQDGYRPDSVTVNLLANGEIIDTVTLSEENEWSYKWTRLDLKAAGQEIEYTVTEEDVDGYTADIVEIEDGVFEITNTHETEKTEVSVKKIWDDADDRDGYRPDGVEVTLFADGVLVDTVTLSVANEWSYTWINLDLKKEGQLIEYTVTEEEVDEYTADIAEIEDGVFEITNTHETEETEVSVTKIWDDADDQDGYRPDSVTVNLLANGEIIDTVTLSEENEWSYKWTQLDLKAAGQEIEYTVTEEEVDEYTADIAEVEDGVFEITNSHETEETEVSVRKIWDDADDQDGYRPDSVTVNLLANGEIIDTVTLSEENEWSYKWTQLDLKAAGQEIEYTVTEEEVDEYTADIVEVADGVFEITNTHETEETEVSVKKIWNDADDQDGYRPDSVTVNLLANGALIDTVTLSEENEWSYTWTQLDLKAAGQEIEYTVTEEDIEKYTAEIVKNADGIFEITNSHETEETEVKVQKVWDDADDQDGYRPDSVTVNLLANGEIIDSVDLSDENEWSYSWTQLDLKAEGQEIEYTVTEDDVDGYTADIVEVADGVFEITNIHETEETEVFVRKIWDDADDQDGYRPDGVEVTLFADGVLVDTVTLSVANEWSYTWINLDLKKEGQLIEYTVTEEDFDEYTADITEDEDGAFTITNSHVTEKTEVSVTKIWDDADDQDGYRPDSVSVNLLANGEIIDTVTLSEENGWSYTWTQLDLKAAGQEIEYTVTEEDIEKYTAEIVKNADGIFEITNSHETEETEVKAQKVWDDADDQDGYRPDSVTVNLLANGEIIDSVDLSDENEWSYKWTKLDLKAAGQLIEYTVTEEEVDEYTADIAEIEDGVFEITNTHETEKTEVSVTKIWDDADDQDGYRPDSVEVNLLANGEVIDSVELSDENGWSYTWTQLDLKAAGQEIEYTVTEEDIEKYTAEIVKNADGIFEITNSHTTEETEVKVQKVWDDADDQDGYRPDSVTVNLLANGEIIDSVDLSDENEWSYKWTQLDLKAAGQEIEYTVTEEDVDGYNADILEISYGVFEITNIHETEKTEVSVTKIWDDADDQDGYRPDGVEVNLLADGEIIDTVTLSVANEWSYTWINLDLKKAGQLIEYTVTEEDIDEYTADIEEIEDGVFEITNSHETEETEVSVTKIWDDADNQDGYRPDSVSVNLLANGEVIDTVTLSAENKWSYIWTKLDLKAAGRVIEYTVTEDTVDEYTADIAKDEDGTFTITNSHVTEETEATVKLIWILDDKEDGALPEDYESMQPQLVVDGAELESSAILNADNQWTYTQGELQKYRDAGVAIKYEWTLGELPAGFEVTDTTVDGTSTTFTITYVPVPTEYSFVIATDLTGRNWNENDVFELTLAADENNPEGAVLPEKTVKNATADSKEVAFDSIVFSKSGAYVFTITETEGSIKGVTYDTEPKTFTVVVKDNGAGTLYVDAVDYTGSIDIRNTYNASAKVQFTATKVLNGRELQEDEFLFALKDEDGNVIQTATCGKDGKIVFDPIVYTEENMVVDGEIVATREYVYTISEVKPEDGQDDNRIVYDDSVAEIRITLTDDQNGKIIVDSAATASDITFTNTILPEEYEVTFVDEDGTVLMETKLYVEGTKATEITIPADPSKAEDENYTYEFAGWTPEITDVNGDVTYKATYTATLKKGVYKLVSDSLSWTKGSGVSFIARFQRTEHDEWTIDRFAGIRSSKGALAEDSDFTKTKGSVILEISSVYMESLPEGKTSFTVSFTDGDDVTFEVDILPEKKQDDPIPPKTADTMEVTWMLVLLGFALTTAMLAARRRKEEKNMRA